MARYNLRKYIPSDGLWHPNYMVSVLSLLMIASMTIAFGPQIPVIIFYEGAILIGTTQAMVYPTLTSYLSFVLSKVGRNMLLGLLIACADLGIALGIALGGVMMGPLSDILRFKGMYIICGILVLIIMIMSGNKQQNLKT